MGKHAYLILAHTNPEQLKTLLGMLDDSRNDIFVHIDAKASFGPDSLGGCCRHAGLFFTENRLSVHWGGVSIMRTEIELLEFATSRGSYSYYHLLSGMDLPIKGQDEIHSFFDANQGKEFIDLWRFKPHTSSRVLYYTIFPEGAGKFLPNLANNIVKGILMLLHIRQNDSVDFRYGSQWFSITDALARYTVSQKEWLERTFRHTNTIDEIFLPTLVHGSGFRDNLYDMQEHVMNSGENPASNMRFIDWTRGESVRHPWVFRKEDFELLCGVPHLWARKFDERVDGEIIRMVADRFGVNH